MLYLCLSRGRFKGPRACLEGEAPTHRGWLVPASPVPCLWRWRGLVEALCSEGLSLTPTPWLLLV